MKIILASASPRRKELLSLMGVQFETVTSNINEIMNDKLNYKLLAQNLSEQKAQNVFNSLSGDRLVIGSDTMVVYKNKIFGKPKSFEQAKEMLTLLSGKWHKVVTGLCVIVYNNGKVRKYVTNEVTNVKFKNISEADIEKYISTHEPMDKAGAYAIQGISGMFIDKINGNYSNVVGLPTNLLFDILKQEKCM